MSGARLPDLEVIRVGTGISAARFQRGSNRVRQGVLRLGKVGLAPLFCAPLRPTGPPPKLFRGHAP